MMSYITHDTPTIPVLEFLKTFGMIPITEVGVGKLDNRCKIFVNGNWLGVHPNLLEISTKMKTQRRMGLIDSYTSIYCKFHNRELWIYTDAGRIVRPVFRVWNNQTMITDAITVGLEQNIISWNQLLCGYHYCDSKTKKERKERKKKRNK